MTAIIDGDMLIYRAGFSCEVETKWGEDLWTLHTSEATLKNEVHTFVGNLRKKLKLEDVKIVFSPKSNFRYALFPEYKANRKGKRKPMGLRALRDWILESYDSCVAEDMEADDLIGIMCTRDPENTIAVSGDKDFGTLPIKWYNHLKDELTTTSQEDADKFHLLQTMAGDTVDGYAGIKGVGTVTAARLLDKKGATWGTVLEAYEKAGMTEDDALLTARLAYILQDKDYDPVTKKITLWSPKQ